MNPQPSNSASLRKKYDQPMLTVYGTVWQLTQRIGRNGNPDGRRFGPRIKTHA